MKIVLTAGIGLICLASASFAQDFDFKTIDKVGAHAKSSTNLNLDGDMLKLGAAFLGGSGDKDADTVKGLLTNVKAMYIREWEFDKPGQYDDKDLEPLRTFLKSWKVALDVHEDGETTQIYFKPTTDNKNGGFALVSAERTEVSIIFIDGSLGVGDLMKLKGVIDGDSADRKADNKSKTGK